MDHLTATELLKRREFRTALENCRNVTPLPEGGVTRRSTLRGIAEFTGPIVLLEPIERGNWLMLRVHFRDGTSKVINSDGRPVVVPSC